MAAIKKSAVIYHYPCPDGVFAALAAHLYFSHSPAAATTTPHPLYFPNTVYSPLRAGDLPLDEIDIVYLLDFVGPPGFVQQLSPKVRRVVVLDHHKTALEMLGSGTSTSGNVTKVIDMERSGATIAYDYFKEKLDIKSTKDGAVGEFQRMKRLFEYIEDGDLWRWRLPNSKAFSSGLKDLNLEFNVNSNPALFQQLLSLDLDSLISQGMSSLAHKQRLIDEVIEQSYEITLGGGAFGHCLVDVCHGTDAEKEYMSVVPYSSAVGGLMYAMICTRPDLAHAFSVVSRFMSNPGKAHWEAVKWIMWYLKGTSGICLVYGSRGDSDGIAGYTDSDYGGDLMRKRSLTCAISWKATLQSTVALSTTEAEFMSLTEGVKEGMWLQGLIDSLGLQSRCLRSSSSAWTWLMSALHEALKGHGWQRERVGVG